MIVAKQIKADLFDAIKVALSKSIQELNATQKDFTEEALRYIVMSELSKKKHWGSFPNSLNSKSKLVFECTYVKNANNNKKYKPDIASFKVNGNKKEFSLAVELKITNDTGDIQKCKEYINEKKGEISFKLASVVYLNIPGKPFEKKIAGHLISAKSKGMTDENSQLLLAYVKWDASSLSNHFTGVPVLKWI